MESLRQIAEDALLLASSIEDEEQRGAMMDIASRICGVAGVQVSEVWTPESLQGMWDRRVES